MKRLGSKVLSGFGYLFFVGLALLMLLPFVYMLVCSLQETYSPYLISFDLADYTLDNFRKTFAVSGFSLWLRNSIFISLSGVFLTLLVCSLGAYAFAKKRFAGSNALMGFLMLSMAIPFTATVVPLWLMMGKLHMIDHYFPLIAPIPSMLGLLLIRQAILSLPNELFESARVDGCRDLRIYWSIVLPVIKPILITVAILYFARSWNSFSIKSPSLFLLGHALTCRGPAGRPAPPLGGRARPWVDTHKSTATARISRAPLGDTGRDAVSVGVQYITPGGRLQVRRGKGAENCEKNT